MQVAKSDSADSPDPAEATPSETRGLLPSRKDKVFFIACVVNSIFACPRVCGAWVFKCRGVMWHGWQLEEKGKGLGDLEADITVASGKRKDSLTVLRDDKPLVARIPQARSAT